jgi:hypothetical protein
MQYVFHEKDIGLLRLLLEKVVALVFDTIRQVCREAGVEIRFDVRQVLHHEVQFGVFTSKDGSKGAVGTTDLLGLSEC